MAQELFNPSISLDPNRPIRKELPESSDYVCRQAAARRRAEILHELIELGLDPAKDVHIFSNSRFL